MPLTTTNDSKPMSPALSSAVRYLNNQTFPAARSRCVGAGHGWFALVGVDDLSVTLVNPVTGRTVSLPPLTRHPMVGGMREDGRVLWRWWLGIWPDSGSLVPAEEFIDTFVRKIVFSASPDQNDYFAVAIGDHMAYAMYARAGAAEWKTLHDDVLGKPVALVHDVVHVDGGRFLAVTRCHGKVLEIDLAVDHEKQVPSVRLYAGALASAKSANLFGSANVNVENHLVLVDGELYQIWASWVGDRVPEEEEEDPNNPVVNRYRIEEVGVVRCAPELPTCWSEAEDLGDWAVLVGRNETVAVRAAGDDGVAGLRGSCVYFIDARLEEEVLCVFDLRSGQQVEVETAASDTLWDVSCSMAPSVWFLSSLPFK